METKSPALAARRGRKRPRRQLHREFLRWLKLNRARFAIGIKIERRSDRHIAFSFIGINAALTGQLSTWDMRVRVDFEGENWDSILWVDQVAGRVPGGYICSECKPEYRRVFPDRVTLWTDHLFEPLLKWVNEKLAKSNWLVLHGRLSHSTSACLSVEPPAVDSETVLHGVSFVIPLKR